MDALFYRRIFLVLVLAALGIALYRILNPFWGALLWAGCLAFLLGPLQVSLTHRLRGRPGLAAGLLTLLTPFAIFVPLFLLGVSFANQARTLVSYLQGGGWRIDPTVIDRLHEIPMVGNTLQWLVDNANVSSAQLQGWAVTGAQTLLRNLASAGSNLLLGAVGTAVSFVLMLFLLFFLLRDGRAMLERLVRLVPTPEGRRRELLDVVGNTTRAVVYGSGLTALVQGTLTGIGFAITGLPSPIVFGVLATLLSLLPAGGAALVWGPAVIALLAIGSTGMAIFMLVWGVAISVSDNVLRPLLVSHHAPVSTLAVFIGVVGGVSAFGAIGLIAGPVILTLIGTLLRILDESLATQQD
jgi:predicted PurR-regulated permease PerM